MTRLGRGAKEAEILKEQAALAEAVRGGLENDLKRSRQRAVKYEKLSDSLQQQIADDARVVRAATIQTQKLRSENTVRQMMDDRRIEGARSRNDELDASLAAATAENARIQLVDLKAARLRAKAAERLVRHSCDRVEALCRSHSNAWSTPTVSRDEVVRFSCAEEDEENNATTPPLSLRDAFRACVDGHAATASRQGLCCGRLTVTSTTPTDSARRLEAIEDSVERVVRASAAVQSHLRRLHDHRCRQAATHRGEIAVEADRSRVLREATDLLQSSHASTVASNKEAMEAHVKRALDRKVLADNQLRDARLEAKNANRRANDAEAVSFRAEERAGLAAEDRHSAELRRWELAVRSAASKNLRLRPTIAVVRKT